MSKNIHSVGIIGLGAFGKLCMKLAPQELRVLGYDAQPPEDTKISSLEEVCQADVVILAVPLSALRSTLKSIKDLLPETTLLVDVCSVKVESSKAIREVMPRHKNILISHPLFGPQTIASGTAGKTFVVCEQHGDKAKEFINFCKNALELNIVTMSQEQHDKEMARVHALTLFLARGLSEVHADKSQFSTPSFDYLKKLVALDHAHTEELFLTIQNGNPYAKEARDELIQKLVDVNETLG